MGTVGHHLVYIHIALGPRAGLPYHQWELVVQFAFENLVAHLAYHIRFANVKHAEFHIRLGSRLFQNGKCPDHLHWHLVFTYFEVLKRALGLCAPILVGRHLYLAHRVFFYPMIHFPSSFLLSGKNNE